MIYKILFKVNISIINFNFKTSALNKNILIIIIQNIQIKL